MQRSSLSIAALATALAKAQIELANPEKSLVGTVEPQGAERGKGGARQFRYAPLSSGLEIARRTLGQHEIATVQTTAIDQTAGVVNLTTVLAHSSGEWIASDWPVCPIAETERPHRMGAALTYARRYALFTLVGIAGEDDLDAPDLLAPTAPITKQARPPRTPRHNGGQRGSRQPNVHREKVSGASNVLEAELSASLRERLLGELTNISSPDEAARWARRAMAAKNSLKRDDAQRVEQTFQAKLATFETETADAAVIARKPSHHSEHRRKKPQRSKSVDKSMLALSAARRLRDREHVKSVASEPCLICGRRPADAHHLRFAQSPALGRKVSDEFTVPLCRGHHRELHRYGDEAAWWQKLRLDPTSTARALWLKTHPLGHTSGLSN